MRIGNLAGRSAIITDSGAIDVEEVSGGRFSADPQAVYDDWDKFVSWAAQAPSNSAQAYDDKQLLAPVPRPRQVFGIGLNYPTHAAEAELDNPTFPHAFTKFPCSIAGPDAVVTLPSDTTIWEAELVVVIGTGGHRIAEETGWSHVAGLTVGQDLSNREFILQPPWLQLSLGKSFPNFGPIGPWVVTPDEFDNPGDLVIECQRNGEVIQLARTSEMVFDVPALISKLSTVVTLMAGDIIFTGTPATVGLSSQEPQFLMPGDALDTTIEGIGTLRTRFAV
jgi:2,4-didehydro-3-deoxy-L-rhamnonate hydrolase